MPNLKQVAKPARWLANPALVATDWRWAWRGLRFSLPLWEGGGPPIDVIRKHFGALESGADWLVHRFGHGVDMSVGIARVNFGNLEYLGGFNALTLEAVIQWTSGVATIDEDTLISKWGAATSYLWRWDSATSRMEMFLATSAGGGSLLATDFDISDLLPHHLLFTWEAASGQGRMYMDGVQSSVTMSLTGTLNTNTNLLVVGNSPHSTPDNFHGIISLVNIYDRFMTPDEVALKASDPFGMFRMRLRQVRRVFDLIPIVEQEGQLQPVFPPNEVVAY